MTASDPLPRLALAACALMLALAACAPPLQPALPTAPGLTPSSLDTPASASIRTHYAQVQSALLAKGLLRTDTNPQDAPFTARALTENFLRIALFEEYAGGQVTRHSTETPILLLRWQEPVRVALRFGEAVAADQQATDAKRVAAYLAHLSKVTGHPISLSETRPNFWLYIASVDDRAALGADLKAEIPGLTLGQTQSVTQMDRGTYCQVLTQSDAASSTYVRAVAVIPSEHPDLMRLACMHEELAQSLGLPNDSKAARPSIFNDDQEFALLTHQDELMLQILYDPALTPGITGAEARPIVETLAMRLLGGETAAQNWAKR